MLNEIVPIIDTIKANKKLREKNKSEDIEILVDLDLVEIKFIEDEYLNVIDAKNRFEDKAKTIIAALTIAITLILNLSKVIETITNKFALQYMDIFVFASAVLSIVYMLLAGIMAIQVLIKENLLYPVSLQERSRQDKECFYIKTQLNINQNLIRNNIIFSSYRLIRNSVICLVIIFVLAIYPYTHQDKNANVDGGNCNSENLQFGRNAVEWIVQNPEKNISFENLIEDNKLKIKDKLLANIYDETNNIDIMVEYKSETYIVLDVKSRF